MLEVCIDAYLYKPAKYFTDETKTKASLSLCVHNSLPTFLQRNIADFTRIEVDCSNDLSVCTGPGTKTAWVDLKSQQLMLANNFFRTKVCGRISICTER